MSNWIDVHLDVLASSPAEIAEIESALKTASEELIAWRAQREGVEPRVIAENVKAIVAFKVVGNLGRVDPSVNKARRFEVSFNDSFSGLVWSHVDLVSRDFPNAVFLAEYWDMQMSYDGKIVIRAGDEIRSSHDGNQRAQAHEWVLPNIFAPYRAEYELGLEFGSLWDQWLEGMSKELAALKTYYGRPPATPAENRER